MRALSGLLLLALAGTTPAGSCYVFWTTQCIEVRDPIRRDITQHVLLSGDKPFFYEAGEGQCRARLDELLGEDGQGVVTDRFNRVLGKIKGCRTLEKLEPEVFSSGPDAYRQYRALDHESAIRKVHRIERLPLR